MKRKLLIGMVLLLVSSLSLVGCAAGVTQEEYDAVVAERDAAQAQVVELEANAAQAAACTEFMAFWMGEKPETEEEMQAYGEELQSRLEALDDAELSAMFDELSEMYEIWAAEGLTEEEIMMAGMEYYMGIFSHIMGKVAEALGVEQ